MIAVKNADGTLNENANSVANRNPIRYRGYVYDTDTGFYYLQSRYYDPEVGRFLNADGYASTGQGVLGTNMFAYCHNNPVNFSDPDGQIPFKVAIKLLLNFFFGKGKDVKYNNNSSVSKKIKKSSTMKNLINNEVKNYSEKGNYNKSSSVTFTSKEPDLWLGVRNASYEIDIQLETKEIGFGSFKKNLTRYVVNVKVSDIYDFNKGNEKGDGIGSILNNAGYWMQENNLGTEYYWEANYEYKTKWDFN